jgi:hypothetical protein
MPFHSTLLTTSCPRLAVRLPHDPYTVAGAVGDPPFMAARRPPVALFGLAGA